MTIMQRIITKMHSISIKEPITYIQPYIHITIHTYVQPYIHTYIQPYIHTYIHTYTHTHTHASYQDIVLSGVQAK